MSDNLTQDAPAETTDVTETEQPAERRPHRRPTSRADDDRPGRDRRARHRRPRATTTPRDRPTDDATDATAAATTSGPSRRQLLEREGEVAADFLETLLDICDLDGDIDVDIDGDRAAVSVVDSEDGRVPRRLVGQNGQVLDALQELTRLAVQSATGERSRLMLDVAEPPRRASRRRSSPSPRRPSTRCAAPGSASRSTPMSAFERKVVHDEVLAAGLVSESEGAEPRRFVVILPA